MTVILHYLDHSRARRIVWTLEELGVKYETKVYYRNPRTMLAPPELKNMHPSGKSPLLEDNGKVYAESALIIDYLIHTYGKESKLAPKNYDEELAIRYHQYAAESNILIYGFYCGLNKIFASKMPWGVRQIAGYVAKTVSGLLARPQLDSILASLQAEIDRNDGFFVNGRLTAADIMYENTFHMLSAFKLVDYEKEYPTISAWQDRIKTIPSYQRTLELEEKWNSGKPGRNSRSLSKL